MFAPVSFEVAQETINNFTKEDLHQARPFMRTLVLEYYEHTGNPFKNTCRAADRSILACLTATAIFDMAQRLLMTEEASQSLQFYAYKVMVCLLTFILALDYFTAQDRLHQHVDSIRIRLANMEKLRG